MLAAPRRAPPAPTSCVPPRAPRSHSGHPTSRATRLAATGGSLILPSTAATAATAATARAASAPTRACARCGRTGPTIRFDLERYAPHCLQGPAGHCTSVVKSLCVEDRATLGWRLAPLPHPPLPSLRALERCQTAFLHVPTSIRRSPLTLLRIEVLAVVLAVCELRR